MSQLIKKDDNVRIFGDRTKFGKVRRLTHRATKAHIKWEYTDEDNKGPRRTVEDVDDLERLSRKGGGSL